MTTKKFNQDTVLTHAGNKPHEHRGVINPPVYRASTILFPTVEELNSAGRRRFDDYTYGLYGTPTTRALEEAVAAIEGCRRAVTLPSGLAAVTMSVAPFVRPGDHVLMADNVYDPSRGFADRFLRPFGIETTYFDAMAPDKLPDLIRDQTRILYLETPGSLTFEVPDIGALAAHARDRGIVVVVDNTWATGVHFKPLDHGADLSVYAATKYHGGHADLMLGMIVCRDDQHFRNIKAFAHGFGMAASPDDCYLALRGVRSLSVRLDRHLQTSLVLAKWLADRPEVERVLHPAAPGTPGHEIWKRDFTGGGGLFSVVLKPVPEQALATMLEGMALFGMGFSWGGYESLILPVEPEKYRTATKWTASGPLLRIHAGLEDPADLVADLEAGFDRLQRAAT